MLQSIKSEQEQEKFFTKLRNCSLTLKDLNAKCKNKASALFGLDAPGSSSNSSSSNVAAGTPAAVQAAAAKVGSAAPSAVASPPPKKQVGMRRLESSADLYSRSVVSEPCGSLTVAGSVLGDESYKRPGMMHVGDGKTFEVPIEKSKLPNRMLLLESTYELKPICVAHSGV